MAFYVMIVAYGLGLTLIAVAIFTKISGEGFSRKRFAIGAVALAAILFAGVTLAPIVFEILGVEWIHYTN